MVLYHVTRRPCRCTKQKQIIDHVLHKNGVNPQSTFSLLFCVPTWPLCCEENHIFMKNSWAANSCSNLKDIFFKFGVGFIDDLSVDLKVHYIACLEAINYLPSGKRISKTIANNYSKPSSPNPLYSLARVNPLCGFGYFFFGFIH